MLTQSTAFRLPYRDNSIQVIFTSPPYYGLRVYDGLPAQVWGGDPACDHAWGQWQESHDVREETAHAKSRTTERFYGDESWRFDGNHQKHTSGAFCQRCGAWLGHLGNEPTPQMYIEHLVTIGREFWRVLRDDGVLLLNLGDSFAGGKGADPYRITTSGKHMPPLPWGGICPGFKPKDKLGIPHWAVRELQAAGWYHRVDIPWIKRNGMPDSTMDRPGISHEYFFLLTKSKRYFWDAEAVKQPSTGQTGAAATFKRNGSKRELPIVGQAYGIHRPDREDTEPSSTRQFRTLDTWQDSLDYLIDQTLAHLAHLEAIRDNGGLLLDDIGQPLALFNATQPYPGSHYACVSEDTEILTLEGWKTHETLTTDDDIATFDIMREEVRYHKPYGIYKYDYNGEMVRICNGWVDQLVTPNHRVLLKYMHSKGRKGKWGDDDWRYIRADSLIPYSGILIPNGGRYSGLYSIGREKAELLGWIIAEGNVQNGNKNGEYSIDIYQSLSANSEKVERIEQLLRASGQNYRRYERERVVRGKPSHEIIFTLNKTENDNGWIFDWITTDKKPRWRLLHLVENELRSLFNGLIGGDGHRRGDGRMSFYQKDDYTQDWFRTLCSHLGLRTTLSVRKRSPFTKQANITNKNCSQIHQSDFYECVTSVGYQGIVWCPQVPNTNFIAKRNGKIFITGNTFPPNVVYDLLKGSVSEKGCCPKCRKPYERVTEHIKGDTEAHDRPKRTAGMNSLKSTLSLSGNGSKEWAERGTQTVTTGWQPACTCNAPGEPVAALVCDPFCGSGTVGEVCRQLANEGIPVKFIGTDLSGEYLATHAAVRAEGRVTDAALEEARERIEKKYRKAKDSLKAKKAMDKGQLTFI